MLVEDKENIRKKKEHINTKLKPTTCYVMDREKLHIFKKWENIGRNALPNNEKDKLNDSNEIIS